MSLFAFLITYSYHHTDEGWRRHRIPPRYAHRVQTTSVPSCWWTKEYQCFGDSNEKGKCQQWWCLYFRSWTTNIPGTVLQYKSLTLNVLQLLIHPKHRQRTSVELIIQDLRNLTQLLYLILTSSFWIWDYQIFYRFRNFLIVTSF